MIGHPAMYRITGKTAGVGRPAVFREGISRRAQWKGRRNVEIEFDGEENRDPCASGASPGGLRFDPISERRSEK